MKKILIAGLINIETTVKINEFPIEYTPIDYQFFGVESTISGVGYNIAKAVKTLGDNPLVLSLIGDDIYKEVIESEFRKNGIVTDYIKTNLKNTAQSTILYDKYGKRRITLDLKDIQDKEYDRAGIQELLKDIDIAAICNINFARGLLKDAKIAGKTIATDVHVVDSINDEYNREFMEKSNILFLSNEMILGKEREFLESLIREFNNEIIVIGMGKEGSLLYVRKDNKIVKYSAINTREVVSTIGAGDALFSAFIHYYSKNNNAYEAIENAMYFASYKIGQKGAASGFLTEVEIKKLKDDFQSM